MELGEIYSVCDELLGMPGVMLSGSKSAPAERRMVWNANIVISGKPPVKVWFGDLSITDSNDKLQELANRTGKTVFILREMDARFDTERKPRLENAVEIYEPLT
jgi:hypothetical protein